MSTIDALVCLSVPQKVTLHRTGITTQNALLALTTRELSKKLNVAPAKADALFQDVITELAPKLFLPVKQVARHTTGRITTGDTFLDDMLGGGIRSGTVTELVGESASGKTQLALQLSLLVQLPLEAGGLSGAACYLTTNGVLQTSRLAELAKKHPRMTPEICRLDSIHTRATPSVPELIRTLSQGLPDFAQQLSENSSAKPLRLLVLDSMGTLFRSDTQTSSKTLFERSRELIEISSMLHHLASAWHLAVLVINDVNSTFDRSALLKDVELDQLRYSEQARWFSRGDSISGEGFREASLGLVWANQVGLRIMMTRTGRRRYLDLSRDGDVKRRNRETEVRDQDRQQLSDRSEAILIRRLSVIFSSFSPPCSTDFVISCSGIISLGDL